MAFYSKVRSCAIVSIVFVMSLTFASTSCSKENKDTLNDQITVANFNIQVFGQAKAEKQEVMQVLAKTISEFDIVALQEIRDNSGTAIEKLEAAVDSLGTDYEYIIGPRLGRTSSKEQYAYMYRTDTITILGEPYTYDDTAEDLFHREPFIAKVKAKNGIFDFVLITIHTDPDQATDEINKLPLSLEDARNHFLDEKDFIILGDLNADGDYFDESDDSSPMFSSEYAWLITNDMDTNLAQSSRTYDRIIITTGAIEDYAKKSGVFKFDDVYDLSSDEAKKVSDHYPVYSTFYINKDTE